MKTKKVMKQVFKEASGLRRSLMMLFLLMAGASGMWASKTYQVVYENVPSGSTGGFSITNTRVQTGNTFSGYSVYAYFTKNTASTTLTVTPQYRNSRYIWTEISEDSYQMDITSDNISNYISATSISGYIAEITVDNTSFAVGGTTYEGKISIKYREDVGMVFYTWTVSPEGFDVSFNLTKSISYTYNNHSYTSTIGGPTTLNSGSQAIYVTDVPYHDVTYNGTTYHVPYYFTSMTNSTPGPITDSNINDYIKVNTLPGYTVSVSNVARGEYTNVNTFNITFSVSTHSMYYKVVYNAAAPSDKGFSLKTTTLSNNTNLTTPSNDAFQAYTATTSSYAPTLINWANVDDVINPTAVSGYMTKVIAGGGSGTQADPYIITINYYQQWEKDGLLYSTFHVESTGHQYTLPAGQVAVSLYRGEDVILSDGTIGQAEQNETDGWAIETITDTIAYNGGINGRNEQLTTTTNETTSASDDDGDAAGTTATYKCLGQLAKDIPCNPFVDDDGNTRSALTFSSDYFYERTHQVAVSKKENVVIPSTVTDPFGNSYDVTAIQKFGFNYAASDQNDLQYCPGGDDNNSIQIADNINDHRNDYLKTVSFATPCQVTSIGDYAFMSCLRLENFTVPYTVSYLGTGTFECSPNMKWVEFQKGPDGTSNVEVIRDWTFWYCTGLERVWLADGLKRIEGQSSGSSFQYLPALQEILLPNTLEYIGPHFLCSATGIKEITIPASVTYIDGALFHGCESLRDVWMLGDAAYLQGIDGTSRTFDYNETLCGDHVNNMTLHVPATYLDNYTSETASDGGFNTWNELEENNAENIANDYRNKIVPVEGQERKFKALRWQSVVFPTRVANSNRKENPTGNKVYPEEVFGTAHSSDTDWDDGTIVAEMTNAVRDDNDISLYHLTFSEVEKTDGKYALDTDKPYMIRPGKAASFVMYDDNDEQNVENFMLHMTDDHTLAVEANDGAIIQMKGWYIQHKLSLYDFIFKDETDRYTFRKNVVDGGAYVGPSRCWWSINVDGIRYSSAEAMGIVKAKDMLDGINKVNSDEQITNPRFVVDAIYDINGRRIPMKQEELPAGLFIINGKKVLVK